jgi:hypothetical protein
MCTMRCTMETKSVHGACTCSNIIVMLLRDIYEDVASEHCVTVPQIVVVDHRDVTVSVRLHSYQYSVLNVSFDLLTSLLYIVDTFALLSAIFPMVKWAVSWAWWLRVTNLFFNGTIHNKSIHAYRSCLSDTMDALNGLIFNRWIPPCYY